MNDWKLPWQGQCMCGRIKFQIDRPPFLTMACHCAGCQKLTASAYSLSLAMPREGLAIMQGEPVRGGLHGEHRQMYCAHCKNWMFTYPSGLDFLVNVRATMLDDHHWYEPYIEVWTSEKLPWVTTSAVHSFASQPDPGGFQPLIEAFAREGARPGRSV